MLAKYTRRDYDVAMRTVSKLIQDLGGATKVATYLGTNRNTVCNWNKRGIPLARIPALYMFCKRKRLAETSLDELLKLTKGE